VFNAEKKPEPKNRPGKPVYTRETVALIKAIRRFYWDQRGSCPAELVRQNIDFLTANRKPDFHTTPAIRARLRAISGRQIDRLLKPAREALGLRGISGATSAAAAIAGTPIRGNSPSPLPMPVPAGCGSTAW
jgi:hypothetical protein